MAEAGKSESSNDHENAEFSLINISKSFSDCFDGKCVCLIKYIDAYKEIVRFFNMMGTLFSFVTSDVNSKIKILQSHLSSPDSDKYITVDRMIEHEINLGLRAVWPNKQLPSGSRTLLRLHRALAFIMRLFNDLARTSETMDDSESFSSLVSVAYNATLAPYHTWLVRKGVAVALYALPSRQSMLQRISKGETEEEIVLQLRTCVEAIDPVFNCVQSLYADNNLLELP